VLRWQQGPGCGGELEVLFSLQLDPPKGFKWGSDRYAAGHDLGPAFCCEGDNRPDPVSSRPGEGKPVCRQRCEEFAEVRELLCANALLCVQ